MVPCRDNTKCYRSTSGEQLLWNIGCGSLCVNSYAISVQFVAVKTILHYKFGKLSGDRVFRDSLRIKSEHINIVDNGIKLTSHRSRIPIANGFGGRKGFMQRELVCKARQKVHKSGTMENGVSDILRLLQGQK
jgi:hypothetical protein